MSKFPGRIVTDLAPAGYSVFFDGTGDFLTVTYPVNWSTYGSYTLEFWFYTTSIAATNYAFVSIGGTGYTNFYMYGSSGAYPGAIAVGIQGTNEIRSANSVIAANTWYHIAYTFDGTTTRIFVNGVLVASGTTAVYPNNSANLVIGNGLSNNFTLGNISNLRLVQGTALYTAAFTPPTQLLRVTNTQLLTCNSPAIIDQSSNAFTITPSGNAAVSTLTPFTPYVPYNPALGASTPGIWTVDEAMQAAATRQWNMYDPYFNLTTMLLHGNPTNATTFITDSSTNNLTITPVGDTRAANLSPFSLTSFPTSGSGYFDGTGDWLTLPSTNSLVFGTGDFCVEFWLNRTGTTGGIFSNSQSVGGGDTQLEIALNGSNRVVLLGWNTTFMTGATTINTNTWYHIAVVRSGTSMAIFVNGTRDATATSANNFSSTNAFLIGSQAGGSGRTTGYVSNLRAVKGSFVYDPAQATITVPTSPLTVITNTSLLTLQNSQSANNNAFLDSSSNSFLITRNGNPTQGTFTPFSQTGWSNYFNGALYISYTVSSVAVLNANSTIELWVYPAALSGQQTFIRGSAFNFGTNGAKIRIDDGTNAGSIFESTGNITANAWNYIALVRSGNTFLFYINGVLDSSNSSISSFFTGNTTLLAAGAFNTAGTNAFTGYMSNLRVSTTARAITLPTASFTSDANTVLLTYQSNRFVDNSSNNYSPTFTGTPSIQAFSPFYPTAAYTPQTIGGSGYFDGSGDYLITGTTAITLGTNNFTMECWVRPNSSGDYIVFDCRSGSNINRPTLGVVSSQLAYQTSGVNRILAGTVPVNAWSHLAVVRNSNVVFAYINGVQVGTYSDSSDYGTVTRYLIGADDDGSPNAFFPGYISSARFVTAAVYTGAFTPPIRPLSTSGADSASAYPSTTNVNTSFAASATSLLCNFTNAGVVDSTGDNVLETVGNAQISTTQSKFGGSSMAFDGTGDYLVFPANPLYAFGTGDFTVEAWVYPTSNAAVLNICGTRTSAGTVNGWNWGILTNGSSQMYSNSAIANTGASTVPLNTWTHLAFVRTGGTIYGYVNGVQRGSTANTENFTINTFWVGITGGTAEPFFGYIDELRITRFARYTGNFTPQTSQWQDQ